jgi:hypothetical protein
MLSAPDENSFTPETRKGPTTACRQSAKPKEQARCTKGKKLLAPPPACAQDRERGVVWEETIIFLDTRIKMVFLSATLANASEFAGAKDI